MFFISIKVMEDNERLRNSHRGKTKENMVTKCNVGSCTGFWNRNRALVEKLMKSK